MPNPLDYLRDIYERISGLFSSFYSNTIYPALSSLVNRFRWLEQTLIDSLRRVYEALVSIPRILLKGLNKIVKESSGFVVNSIRSTLVSIASYLTNIFHIIIYSIGSSVNRLGGWLGSIIINISNSIRNTISRAFSSVVNTLRNSISSVSQSIRSLSFSLDRIVERNVNRALSVFSREVNQSLSTLEKIILRDLREIQLAYRHELQEMSKAYLHELQDMQREIERLLDQAVPEDVKRLLEKYRLR